MNAAVDVKGETWEWEEEEPLIEGQNSYDKIRDVCLDSSYGRPPCYDWALVEDVRYVVPPRYTVTYRTSDTISNVQLERLIKRKKYFPVSLRALVASS